MQTPYILALPVHDLILKNLEIKSLAYQIGSRKTSNPLEDTTSYEKVIDHLIYQHYGLTEEKIKIVDEN